VIDTHAHLELAEAPAVLERARAAGVDRVIVVGTTLERCREALEISAGCEGVVASLGFHPYEAASVDAAGLGELRALLADERAVAVGETGLDYYRDAAPRLQQRQAFADQLQLAADLGLPVVVHTREADADTRAALAGFSGRVVCHCFSSPGLLETALEGGYYVSFAGNLTYPKAEPLREAAMQIPLDRLLVETDSPYLAPQPVRGTRNEPAHVVHTLAALAELRGLAPSDLGRQIDANAEAAFSL
jgi:TatD DNase family protein